MQWNAVRRAAKSPPHHSPGLFFPAARKKKQVQREFFTVWPIIRAVVQFSRR
jgi:hypothetical protein